MIYDQFNDCSSECCEIKYIYNRLSAAEAENETDETIIDIRTVITNTFLINFNFNKITSLFNL